MIQQQPAKVSAAPVCEPNHAKRLVFASFSVVSLAGALVLTVFLLPLRPGITVANAQRIHAGMSRAQVEAIFGGKSNTAIYANAGTDSLDSWVGHEGIALVHFRNDILQDGAGFWQLRRESWIDRSRFWIGQWPDVVFSGKPYRDFYRYDDGVMPLYLFNLPDVDMKAIQAAPLRSTLRKVAAKNGAYFRNTYR